NHSLEKVFQPSNVLVEVVFPGDNLQSLLAHGASKFFVLKNAFQGTGKGGTVHPGNKEPIHTILQPIANTARIERHNRQGIAHDLKANGGNWFGQDGAERNHRTLAIVSLQFFLRHETFEVHAIGQAELFREGLAVFAVIAVTQNDAFKGSLQKRQTFQQDVNSFSANDLPGINNQISTREIATQVWIARSRHWGVNLDALWKEAVLHQFALHELRYRDHAVETLVQRDFALLVRVTHVFQRPSPIAIPDKKCAATKDTIKR